MSDRVAFLRAIIDRPDDDLPRLIFADWLDEHGEPDRAEFIRAQCELAEWEKANAKAQFVSRDRAYALRRREWELLKSGLIWEEQAGLWTRDAPGRYRRWAIEYTFRRGFVEQIACTWADWPQHHAAIRERAPLRRVRLPERPNNERWQFDLSGMMVRLEGCRWYYECDIIELGRRLFPDRDEADVVVVLLAAEFPGMEFELPAANYGPSGLRAAWPRHQEIEDAERGVIGHVRIE